MPAEIGPERTRRRAGPGSRLWTEGREGDEGREWLRRPARPLEPAAAEPEEVEAPRRRRPWRAMVAAGLVTALLLTSGALLGGVLLDGGDELPQTATLPAAPGAAPADGRTRAVRSIYAAASPSIARIQVDRGLAQASGTGFLVGTEGTVVTNAHVVGNADEVSVQLDDSGPSVRGEVLGTDASTDLAVIRVPRSAVRGRKPLALADSSDVQVGDLAVAIGFPLGLDKTATAGIVSGIGRQIQAPNGFSIDRVIQTDAPVNQGNSGGPLIDSRGRVIGVNSQIATTGASGGNVGIAFAVPSDTVREIVPRLMGGGTIRRAYLGVATAERLGGGAQVASVNPSGPADAAGIRVGDVIRSVGGKDVATPEDVSTAIEGRQPGESIKVEVSRDGYSESFDVRLGTRPESAP